MAPEAVAAPHPGRKMSPLCSTSGGSKTLLRIRSLAGSIIDTLESSFQKGQGRNAAARLHQRGLVLLADDVHAQFDAFVADEYGRAGDELAHLVLALAAEHAMERFLGFPAADLVH